MVIDVTACTGCYNCFLACRDEYAGNDYPPYSAAQPIAGQDWLRVLEIERGHYPRPKVFYVAIPCQHCESAPCAGAAEDGAVYRRPDGVVMIDPERARGQGRIVSACPYRVISWNQELSIPQKCTLCAHRLDEGEREPRCVQACPTGALIFGDLADPESEVARAWERAEALHPEFGTDPAVRYIGLPGRFVSGEVVLADCQGECASGVAVLLEGGGQARSSATQTFGNFEFGKLPLNEVFRLTVRHPGYREVTREVITRGDVELGEIVLEPLG